MRPLHYLLAFALILSACENKQTDDAPATTGTATTGPSETTPTVDPGPPPESTVPEAAVKKLVDEWLEAQNSGDFEAYSALYAPKLEGVKRVGAKKFSFDRAGWLADRERMFKKKMEVSAADVEVSVAGRSAVARFEQTWASGDFKDVGPKQLVVVATDDGPRIAREEMLQSTVVGDDAPKVIYRPRQAALMAGDQYVVLALDAEGVSASKPVLVDRSGEAIAEVESPPDVLAGFVGQEFSVERIRKSPGTCTAKVESIHVLARAIPHFGQLEYWNGEMGEPRMADTHVAKEIWDLAKGQGHLVVGKLDQPCENAAWAHAPEQKVVPLAQHPAKGELKDKLEDAFRSLPGHASIQKEFEGFGGKSSWSQSNTNITIYGREDSPKYAFVWATVGDGCGDFIGEFWAAYQVAPNGGLVLLSDPKVPGEVAVPVGAFELDGEVVFLSDSVQLRKSGTVWRRTADGTVPFFGCPC